MNRAYWEGTAKNELRVCKCNRCGARFRFAHEWCPECWNLELGWEKVSGHGTVTNFSVVHQAPYPAFEDVAPYVLALIQLAEGVRIMSNVIGCDPEKVRVGMPVKVTFEKRGDFAIPMFQPE